MRINVINLDRDVERWAEFQRLNGFLPEVVRFPAVEGSAQDRAALLDDGVIEPSCRFTDGALGAALSHTTLWGRALETGDAVTIAEDDAIFAGHFTEAAQGVLAELGDDWDFILWGYNFDAYLWVEIPEGVSPCRIEFSQDQLRNNIQTFRAGRGIHTAVRLRHGFGVMAYTVSPRGAESLLRTCLPFSGRPVPFVNWTIDNITIDCAMNEAYPAIRAHACLPPLAVSENRRETSHTYQEQ